MEPISLKCVLIRKQHQYMKYGLLNIFKYELYSLLNTFPYLRGVLIQNVQVALALSFSSGDCTIQFFFISSILKAHWAIIKRIMGTHHTAFSEVS